MIASLPLPASYRDPNVYVQDLLSFLHEPSFQLLTQHSGIHHLDLLLPSTQDRLNDFDPTWLPWLQSAHDSDELDQMIASLSDHHLSDSSSLPARPASLDRLLSQVSRLTLPQKAYQPVETPTLTVPDAVQKGMIPKKLVEVERLGGIIDKIAQQANVSHVVDIGCGQGYLSRTLVAHGLNVLGIDSNSRQLAGSQRFHSRAQPHLPPSETPAGITYLSKTIESGHTAKEEISSWLGQQNAQGMIVSLHSCGSLTDSIIQAFLLHPNLVGLVAVGCCYNHLVPGRFPTSRKMQSIEFSSTAKMAACSNVSRWSSDQDTQDKSQAISESTLLRRKRSHYRRLLTLLLRHPLIDTTPSSTLPIGAIPTSSLASFDLYALAALRKVHLLPSDVDEAPIQASARVIEAQFGGWQHEGQGRFFETLVKLLGGIIESAIAVDRFLYLSQEEHGLESVGVSIGWDYNQSPRNLIITAEKG